MLSNRSEALNWIPRQVGLPVVDVAGASMPELPRDYLEFLEFAHPGEGFIGNDYLRLYAMDQLKWLNSAYEIQKYLPAHYLFGSNAGGEALLFGPNQTVVKVAFVPLNARYVGETWLDFGAFLASMAPNDLETRELMGRNEPKAELLGLEIHEIKPVAFGGHPTDPANKAFLSVIEHIRIVAFWNKKYETLTNSRNGA